MNSIAGAASECIKVKFCSAGKRLDLACPASLFKLSLSSLTLSQLVSNERAICSVLSFRLCNHHGGERGDKAVLQRHLQRLGCGIDFLVWATTLAAKGKIYGSCHM